ncbi:MAG: ribbon-helix-helix protein, CopG family [Gammaproteobacteria bacterium]|jgi:RHH-type rel operon transcriptional repressor/antitoxin RelB|nr:ribbon-helix-helix protein, CopG family [Gammaproteobacteria bacterium]
MATSIRLDEKTERRLDRLAARTGRTKAYYLRELITGGLDELEEAYLAAATLERVRSGREKIYTAEQVRAELGVND